MWRAAGRAEQTSPWSAGTETESESGGSGGSAGSW